jgi:hypothetical protein
MGPLTPPIVTYWNSAQYMDFIIGTYLHQNYISREGPSLASYCPASKLFVGHRRSNAAEPFLPRYSFLFQVYTLELRYSIRIVLSRDDRHRVGKSGYSFEVDEGDENLVIL